MDGPQSEPLDRRIRQARAKFLAMAATYCAGVLNDNFFRQGTLMLAVVAGRTHLQGYASALFTLPFILFAAPAGYCADRFSKRSIVIASKLLELVAMLFAAVGIFYLNLGLILVTLFIMALQSTLFGPALNGSIPELYPEEYVVTANGIMRMVTTGAILTGTALVGVVLDIKGTFAGVPLGRAVASVFVVGVAATGVIMSFGVPRFPAASPNARFPKGGPLNSIKTLYHIFCTDRLLTTTIIAKCFFWFIGLLQILVINSLALEQFALSQTKTSAMITIELVGIALGSLAVTRLAKGRRWYRVLVPACGLVTVCMFGIALVPYLPDAMLKPIVVVSLGLAGVGGGIFSVPLASFVQIRPSADMKGRIIAASSFTDFTAMLVAAGVFSILNRMGIRPTSCYAIMGVIMALVAVWLFLVLPGKVNTDD